MRILRQSSFKASPWKNGGGVTHEALRVPADGDRFDWRLSVAHIGAPGPFSDFTGYRRTLVLLDGDGLRLTFGDGSQTVLRATGDVVEFDGALSAGCELLGGPCRDLNLIVSMSLPPPEVFIRRLTAPLTLVASAQETCVVFCLQGPVAVPGGLLHAGDLMVISGEAVTCRAADPAAVPPVSSPRVFQARLNDLQPTAQPQTHM